MIATYMQYVRWVKGSLNILCYSIPAIGHVPIIPDSFMYICYRSCYDILIPDSVMLIPAIGYVPHISRNDT